MYLPKDAWLKKEEYIGNHISNKYQNLDAGLETISQSAL